MVLVVLAVSTVLVVLQVVDPNDYKPQISALVEEKTGRRLDLAGDLQLTFFPWVGIETGPLSLSNAEGFGDVPMISADNARIRVKLLPLIKRRVEAGTVVLDAPVVHLLTAVDGRTNWDDLAGMGDEYGEERAEREPAALAGLAVQGVSVTDGRLVWHDAVAGNELVLSDLDLSTGMLVPGEPLDVTLSLDATGAPLPGPAHLEMETTVTLSRNMSSLSLGNTGLILSSDAGRVELSVEKVSYALEAGLAAINGVITDMEVDGTALRLTMPSLNLNLSDETLAVPSLELTQEDSRLTASFNAAGFLSPEFEGEFSILSGDLGHLLRSNGLANVELPATYTHVDGAVAFAFREDELQLLNLKLAAHVNGLPTQMEIDRLNYHLRNESLTLPSIRVRQEDFRLDASLAGESLLSDPSARRLAGRVDLALNDVEELLTRNGLPVTPPLSEVPLSEIRLVGGVSLEGSAVTANSVVAEFVYRGQETRVDVSSLVLDPDSGKLDLTGFRFQQDGFDLSGRMTGDRVFDGVAVMDAGGDLEVMAGNLADFLTRNALLEDIPPAVPKSAQARLAFTIRNNNLDIDGLEAVLDDMRIQGSVGLRDLSSPGYRFDLRADRLDLDALLAAAGSGAGQEPHAGEQLRLPLESLRGLDADGRVRIGTLVTPVMNLDGVDLRVRSSGDILRLAPATASLFGGTVEAQLAYDVSGDAPALELTGQTRRLDVGSLLRSLDITGKIEGTGNLDLALSGRGADVNELVGSLDGRIAFRLRNGALKGYDLQAALLELESLAASLEGGETTTRVKPEAETRFAEMAGSFRVEDGVFRNDDLVLKAPLFRIAGRGVLNLPGDLIDYSVDVNVVDTVEGQGGAALAELKGARIPLRIRGPLAGPGFTLDLSSLVEERAKKELKRKLLEKVGIPLQKLTQGAPENAAKDKVQEQELEDLIRKKLEDGKEKLKKGLLKGLGF